MGHSTVRNVLHCISAVNNRRPLLHPDIRPSLFAHILSIAEQRYPRCRILALNGVRDHVHLLLDLHQAVLQQDIARDIKAGSSYFLNQLNMGPSRFSWQTGYAAFGCRYDGSETVADYIERQEAHHREEDFLDEYIRLLKENGIDYYDLHPDDRLV